MGIVISASRQRTGDEFAAAHRIGRFPHHVDMDGRSVTGHFGVTFSPSALMFRDGQPAAAYMFHDVAPLRATVTEAPARPGLPQHHRETV